MNLRQAAQMALDAWFQPHGINYVDFKPYMEALRAALAEPEQPHDLLCVCGAEWDIYPDGREELVAAPTPRKPLTDEEMYALARQVGFDSELMKSNHDRGTPSLAEIFARAIERAHGIGEQT